jgi:hypothetical protein
MRRWQDSEDTKYLSIEIVANEMTILREWKDINRHSTKIPFPEEIMSVYPFYGEK